MPSRPSWMKLKLLRLALEFIFQNWMRTYTFQVS